MSKLSQKRCVEVVEGMAKKDTVAPSAKDHVLFSLKRRLFSLRRVSSCHEFVVQYRPYRVDVGPGQLVSENDIGLGELSSPLAKRWWERLKASEAILSSEELLRGCSGRVAVVDFVTMGQVYAWQQLQQWDLSVDVIQLLGVEAAGCSPEELARRLVRQFLFSPTTLLITLDGFSTTFRFRRRFLGNLVRFQGVSLSGYQWLARHQLFDPPLLIETFSQW